MKKLEREFFMEKADVVAKKLLGKIIVRKIDGKKLIAKIVETEAYFSESDPASWARHGKRKDNIHMWSQGGIILVKNVHKHKMLNFVAGVEGKAEAVLIRAVEPVNFSARCSGPGLLTENLKIGSDFNGVDVCNNNKIFLFDSEENNFKICKSFRIGVVKDLNKKLRFYIKDNACVSKNGKRKNN